VEPSIPEASGQIVNDNGVLYYYENGARKYAGLIYLDGSYYYVRSNAQLVVGRTYWVTKTNDLLPAANYEFGADGKMINN
jgi:glucan-binding YG repeat protein